MSSSVSNKVHGDNLVGDGAVAKRPANDGVVKNPANNGAVLKSPANDEAMAASDPPDDDESATADTELLPIKDGGGGGGGGGGVSVPVTIEVTATRIDFDQERAATVGYLMIDAGVPEMKSPDSDTVLRLLFFLTYTKAGRDLLMEYTFDRDDVEGLLPGETRSELKGELKKEFPSLSEERLEIALDAHFAAGAYANAFRNKTYDKLPPLQEIYKQKLAAMLGALYDDSMGRDFSCVW